MSGSRSEAVGPLARPSRRALLASALALALIVLDTWPPAPLNASVRSSIRATRTQAERVDRVEPLLRCAVASVPGADASGEAFLFGPALLRPRLAKDLELPLGAVGGTAAGTLDPSGEFLPNGTIVLHDRPSARPAEAFAILEIDRPTTIAGLTLTPLLADPDAGVWVLWIGRPGGPPAPTACSAAPSG